MYVIPCIFIYENLHVYIMANMYMIFFFFFETSAAALNHRALVFLARRKIGLACVRVCAHDSILHTYMNQIETSACAVCMICNKSNNNNKHRQKCPH